jgi:hypothetical protein
MNNELKESFIEMMLKLGNRSTYSYLDKHNNLYKIIDGQLVCKKAISKDGGFTYDWE